MPPRNNLHSQYRMVGVKSQADLNPVGIKIAERPTTAGIASTFGISDMQTAGSMGMS